MKKLRERLKPLTLKAKMEYLFEYYSFHMITPIVIIILLAVGIHSFTNQKKEILAVRIVGAKINVNQTEYLQEKFASLLAGRPQKEKLSFDILNTSDTADQTEKMARIQKLGAEIAANDVDVLLVDEKTFHQFNKEGDLYDLSSLNRFKDWKEKTYSSPNDVAKITGIDVSKVSLLSSIEEDSKPLIFAVLANTKRMDEVKKFIHYLK